MLRSERLTVLALCLWGVAFVLVGVALFALLVSSLALDPEDELSSLWVSAPFAAAVVAMVAGLVLRYRALRR